eukprot:CAMPEP_0184687850 /NCGR_PEP_ID=MMETSP0312-20130426/27727_1 /TAXON_ID=31354 /ORGANISM="Compsopogon coeruleus, Strain SAG 36.94" /LENGTH=1834 /DNA_ID=CAMNT_0027144393 /DNA_START=360 /DNA_END=5864 /DNA_ORIENTATION=-
MGVLEGESRTWSEDLPLHRYNLLLPEVYRDEIQREMRERRTALHVLADAICSGSDEEDTEGVIAGIEGYERVTERDIAGFEKGLSIHLDLKYVVTQEDCDKFGRLLVRAVLSQGIDLGLRAKCARTLTRILRKSQCHLSFPMPWRGFRDIISETHIESAEGSPFVGKDVRDAHCREMSILLRKSRNFLGPDLASATREIWEDLGLKIDPFRVDKAFEPLLMLSHILPTRGNAWNGWVPRAIELWGMMETSLDWDNAWLGLIARLARDQPNSIDWSPYLGMIYQRIALLFKLPLGAVAPQAPVERRCPAQCAFLISSKYPTIPAAVFCIYSLTPRSPETSNFLMRLIALLTNFYHPSNHGKWSSALAGFLGHITSNLVRRVALERSATAAGVNSVITGSNEVKAVSGLEDRLSKEMVDDIVKALLPVVELGLHAKVNLMTTEAAASARDLAAVAPALIVRPLLDLAVEGLDLVATPHRTSASLRMLASLTPVFLDPHFCPDGAESLPQALQLTLPGIDANDPSKTEATFRFIAGASARIQSRLSAGEGGELTLFLEEYTHALLDRIFALLEALEAPPKKTKNGAVPAAAPSLSSFIFSVAMDNFFAAVPEGVATSAAERVAREVSSAATTNAMKYFGSLVRTTAAAASRCQSESSASIFLPTMLSQVVEGEIPNANLSSLSEEEMVWRLRMLAQACRTCRGLVPYCERLYVAASLALRHPSRKIYKAGGRLLRGILEGLTSLRMKFEGLEERAITDYTSQSFCWVVHSQEEWNEAERYLTRALDLAEELAFGEVDSTAPYVADRVKLDREGLFHAVRVLHAAQRGGRWLMGGVLNQKFDELAKFQKTENLGSMTKYEAKLVLRRPTAAGLGGELGGGDPKRSRLLWTRTYAMISSVLEAVMRSRPDDGALLYRCLEPIELAHEPFKSKGRASSKAERGYKSAYLPVVAMKHNFGCNYGIGRIMPRFVLKLRIESLHETRLTFSAIGGLACMPLHEKLTSMLAELSLNDFPRVRARSRGCLTRSLRVCAPAFRRKVIEEAIAALEISSEITPPKETPHYETMIGAADVLRSLSISPYIMRDWRLREKSEKALLKSIVAAGRADASIVVHGLFSKLASLSRPLGVGPLILASENFVPFETCVNEENALSSPSISSYRNSTAYLLGQVKQEQSTAQGNPPSPDSHWRLQSFVATSLYLSIRGDVAPSDGMLTYFVTSLLSDLIVVRQISMKALALILVLHERGEVELLDSKLRLLHTFLEEESFAGGFLKALALDQVDEGSESGFPGGVNLSLGTDPVAGRSMMNLAKYVDGDACWVLASGKPWPSTWVARSRDNLSLSRVRFFEVIFRVFGITLFAAFRKSLAELIQDPESIEGATKSNCRTVVLEAVAGMCRGLNHSLVDVDSMSEFSRWVNTLIDDPSGHEGMVNAGTFIRLLGSGVESSVGHGLRENLLTSFMKDPNSDEQLSGQILTRRLRYIHSCAADLPPDDVRGAEATAFFVPILTAPMMFSHYLKSVREETARLLSLFVGFSDEGAVMAYSRGVDTVALRLGQREPGSLDGEGPSLLSDGERKSLARECETLSRWVSVIHWVGETPRFGSYLPLLLPAVFLSFDDSDPERLSHARLALSLSAQSRLSRSNLRAVVDVCNIIARSPRWKMRGSILGFLQVLAFVSNFSGGEEILGQIRTIIIGFLSDEQLEVREGAAHTLVPLLRDAPENTIKETRELLLSRLTTTQPRARRRKDVKPPADQIIQRHSAVLGLASMVMSSPYTLPSWMPGVLMALARQVDDYPPISTSSRKIFVEFWRTHRDEWATHKRAFAEDELEIVSDLLISPSYYA